MRQVILFFCFFSILASFFMFWSGVSSYSDFSELQEKLALKPQNTRVYASGGELIAELYEHNRSWISFAEIPQTMVQTILALEDRNFFDHPGIDILSIIRAGIANLKAKSIRQGASTITQQLVRNFYLSREKSFQRKWQEAVLALQVETRLSKEQIFELYVNSIELGRNTVGIAAAAKRYFAKELNDLEFHQMLALAMLFKNPHLLSRDKDKADLQVKQKIKQLHNQGFITASDYALIVKRNLQLKDLSPERFSIAPHFIDEVEKWLKDNNYSLDQGLKIHTTLDLKKQIAAQKSIRSYDYTNANKRILVEDSEVQTALLAMDPKSGGILSTVGSSDYKKSQFHRSFYAQRSPGSVFKTIVYTYALKQGRSWSDIVFATPIAFDDYRPRNFGDNHMGYMSMLKAFYKSINTATLSLGMSLGLDEILQLAKDMGIESELRKEAGTLIGSSEVNMLDLARAYAVIANGGKKVEHYFIARVDSANNIPLYEHTLKKPVQILSSSVTSLITIGLQAVLRHGTAARYSHLAKSAAGKTGTSNDAVDNWFVGFTQDQVIVSWVGTDQREAMDFKATGSDLALPLFADYLTQQQHDNNQSLELHLDQLKAYTINPDTAQLMPEGQGVLIYQFHEPTRSDFHLTRDLFRDLMRY
jgi:membrane peptidoglycan carboxypeptidase